VAVLVAVERPDIVGSHDPDRACRHHRGVGGGDRGLGVLAEHEDAAQERKLVPGEPEWRRLGQAVTNRLERGPPRNTAVAAAVGQGAGRSRAERPGHAGRAADRVDADKPEVGSERGEDPPQDIPGHAPVDEVVACGNDERDPALDEEPDERRELRIEDPAPDQLDERRRLTRNRGLRHWATEIR